MQPSFRRINQSRQYHPLNDVQPSQAQLEFERHVARQRRQFEGLSLQGRQDWLVAVAPPANVVGEIDDDGAPANDYIEVGAVRI